MPLKVGDPVRYRDTDFIGTVYQVEGGRNGDLTEVWWPSYEQASWVLTVDLNLT